MFPLCKCVHIGRNRLVENRVKIRNRNRNSHSDIKGLFQRERVSTEYRCLAALHVYTYSSMSAVINMCYHVECTCYARSVTHWYTRSVSVSEAATGTIHGVKF
jgi:hypothetical protein